MKLHTNTLTRSDIREALAESKAAGLIDPAVGFEMLEDKGSRSHSHAFEVQLGWYGEKIKGDGRRYKNSGKNGSDTVYAATYDEWGEFIADLMDRDHDAVFGTYKGYQGFHEATNWQYGGPS